MLSNLLYIFRIAPGAVRKSLFWELLHGIFVASPTGMLLLIIWELFEPEPDQRKIWWIAGIMGGMLLLQFYIASKTLLASNQMTFQLSNTLRLKLGNHLQRLSMGYFKKRDPGDLASVVLQDVANFETIFGHTVGNIAGAVFATLTLSVFLFAVDWRLALLLIAALPLGYLFVKIANWVITKQGAKLVLARNATGARFLEYVQGIRFIKSYGMTGAHFKSLERAMRDFKKASIRTEALPGPFVLLAAIIFELFFLGMVGLGVGYFETGTLSIPVLIAFLIMGYRLYEPLKVVLVDYVTLRYMNISLTRIIDLLKAEEQEWEEDCPPEHFDIAFDHVNFSYTGDENVLKGISFYIPEKSMVALVGPSGSGKTTIANLIARFWDAQQGSVMIGGIDIQLLAPHTVYQMISEVFQEVYLFDDTVYNNILIGNPKASKEQVWQAAKAAQCQEFIRSLPQGMETRVGEGGSRLSGGQKQRVSIARAMLKDAPIVLLDEATASLDPENEVYIQRAIQQLVKDKTVVVIAHKLQTIKNANQIIVLDQGRIKETGDHTYLMEVGGLYTQLWNQQQKAQSWKIKTMMPANEI
ncbi:ABC transporter ATP-binding protein [Rapidithrix thailandica]|uniref:ABC transporter ATP-binding protein n=1 Tax=Rapidithrix thailandica TaxID=413964 RepID=A0AAW9S461_9BACT